MYTFLVLFILAYELLTELFIFPPLCLNISFANLTVTAEIRIVKDEAAMFIHTNECKIDRDVTMVVIFLCVWWLLWS